MRAVLAAPSKKFAGSFILQHVSDSFCAEGGAELGTEGALSPLRRDLQECHLEQLNLSDNRIGAGLGHGVGNSNDDTREAGVGRNMKENRVDNRGFVDE